MGIVRRVTAAGLFLLMGCATDAVAPPLVEPAGVDSASTLSTSQSPDADTSADAGLQPAPDVAQPPDDAEPPDPAERSGLDLHPALGEPCGQMPPSTMPTHTEVYRPSAAGCGLALGGAASIERIEVVILELDARETRVGVVFLDAHGRRVLPIGESVSWEMQFKRRASGRVKLRNDMHIDGLFHLVLPRNQRAAPCRSHLFVRMKVGGKKLEYWLDDWLYSC